MAKRILIADDSLTIQKAFAMTFAGEDVTLLAARSADEGLTIARQARPELVIADAVMPGRSGYDLCSAIKADAALRGVPVYILASTQNPYDESRGRQSGADGQFTKPFESVALVERVKEAIALGVAAPIPVPVLRAAPSLSPAAAPPAASLDDDYGEISIEDSGPQREAAPASPTAPVSAGTAEAPTPPPMVPLAAPRPATPSVTTYATLGGMRPSLIPGLRPGAAPPPARPGASLPARPVAVPGLGIHPVGGHPGPVSPAPSHAYPHSPTHSPAPQGQIPTPLQIPALRAPFPQAPQQAVARGPARTLVGLPGAVAPSPAARFGSPAAPARPATQPVRPMDGQTPPPLGSSSLFPAGPSASASVSSKIDQKVAEFAAKGPEYEAIARLSREIIEKIVWEVVPELAETIIREELQKRGRI
jgi:CheY-like chemotaxis protein